MGGKAFFTVAGVAMRLSFYFGRIMGLFTTRRYVDEAPELR